MAKKDKDPRHEEVEITGSTADTHKVSRMTVYHDMLGGIMDHLADMDRELNVMRERIVKLEKIHSAQIRVQRIKGSNVRLYLLWVLIILCFMAALGLAYYSQVWRSYT